MRGANRVVGWTICRTTVVGRPSCIRYWVLGRLGVGVAPDVVRHRLHEIGALVAWPWDARCLVSQWRAERSCSLGGPMKRRG